MTYLPLPLREQAEIQDRWLAERLDTILPALMDRANLDMWIVTSREYNEDPVALSLLPATWLSVRRRTTLVFVRTADRVLRYSVLKYPIGELYTPAWDCAAESQWNAVRRLVDRHLPRRIGIDVSATFALADGLSKSEHDELVGALDGFTDRLVGAEEVAIGWLETRLPAEIETAHELNSLAHEVIATAFSSAVIDLGTTTATDVAWWIRQRFHDLGVNPWFQPTVDLQRADGDTGDLIAPGDVLHCDVGLASLGLHTDTQQVAYVLRSNETVVPAGLDNALAVGNAMQDLTADQFRPGSTGNQALKAARAAAGKLAIDGDIYSHPIGRHGHAAGPSVGMWDNQVKVPGAGDYRFYDRTMYALELCVRVPIDEWDGRTLVLGLEQGIAINAGKVEYLDARQTEWITVS